MMSACVLVLELSFSPRIRYVLRNSYLDLDLKRGIAQHSLHRFKPKAQTLGLQVYKYRLLWGLKSLTGTYFGLFGAPGKVKSHQRFYIPTPGYQTLMQIPPKQPFKRDSVRTSVWETGRPSPEPYLPIKRCFRGLRTEDPDGSHTQLCYIALPAPPIGFRVYRV